MSLLACYTRGRPEAPTVNPPLPPLDYLLECSEISLGDLEMKALERSANCLKRAKQEWTEGVAQREVAGIARWLIENRPALLEQARRTLEADRGQPVLEFPQARRTA